MTIYEKMLEIMNNVQYLAKDDKVQFNQTSYRALSEEKVTSIMRQQLTKYKLVVYPISQIATRDGNITHVDMVYRMVNVENHAEFIEIASAGDGADTQDKGTGKAMTYAFKYMWLRTFALPTGEDPDKISSDELDVKFAEEKAKEKQKEEVKTDPPTKETVQKFRSLVTDEQWNATVKKFGEPEKWTEFLTQKWIAKLEANK